MSKDVSIDIQVESRSRVTGTKKGIDFVFISEVNKIEGSNWYLDTSKKAEIMITSNHRFDDMGLSEAGFRWISLGGIRWLPRTSLQDFNDFLARLDMIIRSAPVGILVSGDFNSQHTDWARLGVIKEATHY